MSKNSDITNRKLFIFEAQQNEFEQIQALFESGELSKLLGVRVIDVGIVPESQRVTSLSQWFKGIVEAGWQTLEALFNT